MMVADSEFCPGPLSEGASSSRSAPASAVGGGAAAGRAKNRLADLNQRALLFGSRLGLREFQRGRGHDAAQRAVADLHAAHAREFVEEQNEAMIGSLHDKVAVLKSVAFDVGREASDSSKFVEDMDGSVDRARRVLGGTLSDLRGFMSKAGTWHMLHLVVFFLVMMFVLFFSGRFVASGGRGSIGSTAPSTSFLAPSAGAGTGGALGAAADEAASSLVSAAAAAVVRATSAVPPPPN